jgi:hypothetical protein
MLKNVFLIAGWLAAAVAFGHLRWAALVPPQGVEPLRSTWESQATVAAVVCGVVAAGGLLVAIVEGWRGVHRRTRG